MSNEISEYEKELVQKAFKYTDQHRSELERTLESDKSGHKGHVVDEEHDGRLSENKEKKDESDEKAKQEQEEKDEREKAEIVKRNKERLMQIKKLQENKATSSGLSSAASIQSNSEIALRSHLNYGSAINQVFGSGKVSISSMKTVRASLQKRLAFENSIDEKNELHQSLSHVAVLLIKAGALSENNG